MKWLDELVNPVFPLAARTGKINAYLVFTKSVNSNFCAFLLPLVSRNILGYSRFCDRSQDGVYFFRHFRKTKFER